jgi:hypothetical protein
VSLQVVFHDLAEFEMDEAAAYYATARPGLGEAFIIEVERAVGLVVRDSPETECPGWRRGARPARREEGA